MANILTLVVKSQTSHLILRRLRALGVFAELLPCTTQIAELTWKPKGIIFSGGIRFYLHVLRGGLTSY
jgi:GMP synthase (glutamine-hydrolysing)